MYKEEEHTFEPDQIAETSVCATPPCCIPFWGKSRKRSYSEGNYGRRSKHFTRTVVLSIFDTILLTAATTVYCTLSKLCENADPERACFLLLSPSSIGFCLRTGICAIQPCCMLSWNRSLSAAQLAVYHTLSNDYERFPSKTNIQKRGAQP